jgi:elongation factor G
MTGQVADIRNIAFVGHPASGKTTLVDALAFATGAAARKGSVAEKTSICDTEPEEQDKQHTLQMSAVYANHAGEDWTFLDTPGYPEFVAETNGAMFGADLVVGVVSCLSGVTYNLRTKLAGAIKRKRGRAIVMTHLDGENASFESTMEELRTKIGEVCVPVTLPDESGLGFSAVKQVMADPESEWCQRLMDRVMDACEDEELLTQYLETQKLSEEELRREMPHAINEGALIPVLVCNPASEPEIGVKEVLEFFEQFAPSPDSHPVLSADKEEVKPDPAGPLVATVFNVKADPHVGKVCLAKVFAGTLNASDTVAGLQGSDKSEKLGGLFRMVGKKREPIESAGPGSIVAFSKVEHVGFGESFTVAEASAPRVPMLAQPDPMVALAITPKSRADEQKIGEALTKLSAEDPTFQIEHTRETHELVLHGMSDLHLQVMEMRLKRRFGVEIDKHIPRIAYKETITRTAEGHHRHKKQSGGRGQFGECYLRVKPLAADGGVVFNDNVVGGSIPRNLIPAVEKGMREIASEGILTKSQVVDVEVELYDGKFHAVDSDEASFRMAGARAFKDGFEKAGPVLLEPIMEVQIHVPTGDAGTVFSDVTSQRRGHVLDQWNEEDGAITGIKAHIPLATIQTYHRDLKSQTAGEGTFTMSLISYSKMPANEQQRVLADMKNEKAE